MQGSVHRRQDVQRQNTYDGTVGAGDGGAAALRAGADTDNGDGAAGEADKDVEVLKDDVEALEDGSTRVRVGLEAYVSEKVQSKRADS